MSDGGKGSTQRPETRPGAYGDGYDRIFGTERRERRTTLFGKDAKPAKEGGTPKDEPWPEQ